MMERNIIMISKRILSLLVTVLVVVAMINVAEGLEASAKKKVKVPAMVAGLHLQLKKNVKFTLKWKKAKRAAKYQVYVKKGAGRWKKAKTTKTRVYKMTGAYDTKYSFKVRGVNGKKKGKFSRVSSLKTFKKPKPIVIKPDQDSSGNEESAKDEGDSKDNSKDNGKKQEITPEIYLLDIISHKDREFGSGKVYKCTTIHVKVNGAKGQTLRWYRAESPSEYDDANEEDITKSAFTSNSSEAWYHVTEGSEEKYVFCSFTTKDGKEIKSKIFTVPKKPESQD